MIVLDGKATSAQIRLEIAEAVKALHATGKKTPHLCAFLIGNNGASETYVAGKVKACEEVGFLSTLKRFPETISQEELVNEIEKVNNDPDIDGLIVQMPLPKHIDELTVTLAIDAKKDVDGFHPTSVGRMALNLPTFLPATPAGVLELLKRYHIPTSGKHCVVIGRSHIVGSPMSILMARNSEPGNCTVTLTHSKTTNLKELCLQADIIVAALGKPEFLTADMVKDGAIIIDVGITRVPASDTKSGFRLKGDVKYDEVAPKCSAITPVPGGVGPMTITMLMLNTLKAVELFGK
jgi:methylenetetrahydrofolate dehydrogenase (NADP+)/methenyltetrahydrofolate cyclohydrolase